MINHHHKTYPSYPLNDRLAQLDLSPAAYHRLRHANDERSKRESQIMEEEIEAMTQLIFEHPHLGAGKLQHTLIDQEQAIISSGFINEAKRLIAEESEKAYRIRLASEKTLQAALRERQKQEGEQNYQHIQAEYPHHIWAIDFVFLRFLSFQFTLAVVYDVYSQAYLSLLAGSGCTAELAARALDQARVFSGCNAGQFLRRDNGKAFITESFQELLTNLHLTDLPIPPGSPWFNGSLESNNGNLKTTIKALGMQEMVRLPKIFSSGRRDIATAGILLQESCDRTLHLLNDEISRPKFKMPPRQVLDGQTDQVRHRHEQFIHRRKTERRERMLHVRQQAKRKEKDKTFLEKVRSRFRQMVKEMNTDVLFIFNETIHHRYHAIEA